MGFHSTGGSSSGIGSWRSYIGTHRPLERDTSVLAPVTEAGSSQIASTSRPLRSRSVIPIAPLGALSIACQSLVVMVLPSQSRGTPYRRPALGEQGSHPPLSHSSIPGTD